MAKVLARITGIGFESVDDAHVVTKWVAEDNLGGAGTNEGVRQTSVTTSTVRLPDILKAVQDDLVSYLSSTYSTSIELLMIE